MCSVEGCEKVPRKRGWCYMHYQRWNRHGSTTVILRTPSDVPVWDKILLRGWTEVPGPLDTPCWWYDGTHEKHGYGNVRLHGRIVKTHRVSYEHFVGPIPDGLIVRHRCDVRICLNPDHLEVGTNADNVRDRDERGRGAQHDGENSNQAKLTWVQVREIRASTDLTRFLVKRYGVSRTTIQYIRSNKSWKESTKGATT